MTGSRDTISHSTWTQVEKYTEDQVNWVSRKSGILAPNGDVLRRWMAPDSIEINDDPNLTTTNGLGRLTSFLIGTGSLVGFDSTHSMIGVGDTATAAAAADTQLGSNSAAHSWYIPTDSAPTRVTTTVTNDTIQAVGTFNTSNSDFAWQEWGLVLVTTPVASATFAGTGTSPILFNHKAPDSKGTKSGGSWVFTVKLTWS